MPLLLPCRQPRGRRFRSPRDQLAAGVAEGRRPAFRRRGDGNEYVHRYRRLDGLAAALGDKLWARTIARHLEMLAACIEENGGTLVKTLGDGSMSSFPSARRAMLAALSIQRAVGADQAEPRLGVRVGLHSGDTIQTGGDFYGTVVNKAARIAGATRPGEILVSAAARAMVSGSGDFDFGQPLGMRIRSLDGETDFSTLRWEREADTGAASPWRREASRRTLRAHTLPPPLREHGASPA